MSQPVGERMPVLIQPGDFDVWLSGTDAEAAALLRAPSHSPLVAHPVSRGVNKAENDDAGLIDPLPQPAEVPFG